MMGGPERLRARAFTDFAPRSHHDVGQAYSGSHYNVQPYPTTGGLNYVTNNSYMQYSTIPPNYSPFPATYAPSHSTSQAAILFSYTGGNPMTTYSVQPPPRTATLPSQQRIFSRGYSSSAMNPQHSASTMYYRPPLDYSVLHETEEQDSVNRESGESEPVEPALEGYPDVNDFEDLMRLYVAQLSPKKQDKALINAARASNIRFVLSHKKTTQVESAQFRFWAKKMFQLQPNTGTVPVEKRKICHENKPIAVREKLFKILTRAHQKCQHGGRDKTSAQVRKVYSWVPKELISRFVKLCPTCRERRGTICSVVDDDRVPSKLPPTTPTTTLITDDTQSPPEVTRSSLKRRRSPSIDEGRVTKLSDMRTQLVNSSSAFRKQNRWLSDLLPRPTNDEQYTIAAPYPTDNNFTGLDSSLKLSTRPLVTKQDTSQVSESAPLHPSEQQSDLHFGYD